MKRLVSHILIAVMMLNMAPLALAQTELPVNPEEKPPATNRQVKPTAPPRPPKDSTGAVMTDTTAVETPERAMCRTQGNSDAKHVKTGGSFGGGFAGGVLLGLIGTTIAILAQKKPEPPINKVMEMPANDCRKIYAEAYRSAGRGKKQASALVGGLIGTAVIVTVLVLTKSED